MIGREAERAQVAGFLQTPGPAMLALVGTAGIGKTILWRAGIEVAHRQGRQALAARGAQVETEMAWAGLQSLLGGAVEVVGATLPAPQQLALDVVLLREKPSARGLDPRTVATATLSLLRALAVREPVLVAIDDLQWLDPETVSVLSFALARLREEDVLVLAAARPGTKDLSLGLERERVSRLSIGRMEVEDLRAVVHQRLGMTLSRPDARRLARISGGNPLYAIELVRVAGRRGIRGEPLRPSDVEELIGDQLAQLPEPTRDAVGVVAALAQPRMEVLTSALPAIAVLDPAFGAGVLEQEGDELRFAHPLLAAGAYAALLPARRREIHRRLAAVITLPEERARHLAAAAERPDETIAAVLDVAAAAAAARAAPGAAAELLEAAARLTPSEDADGAGRRRLAGVRQLFAAGESARAVQLGEALIAELPPGELRADVLTTVAWRGVIEFDRAAALCEQAAAECETRAARARCLLLFSNVMQGRDGRRALAIAREALELLDDRDDPAVRAWAMTLVGSYEVQVRPDGDGVALLRQALALETQYGSAAPDPYMSAAAVLGLALSLRDEMEEARSLLLAARSAATASGSELGMAGPDLHLAALECRAGNLSRARAHADECVAIHDEGIVSQPLGAALYVRALVAALEGDVEEARALAQRGIAVGRSVGDSGYPALNLSVLGTLELSLGDARSALRHLESVPGPFEEVGYREPGVLALFEPDRIQALIEVGRHQEATEALSTWERLGRDLDRPRVLATAARLRGLLAAANGDIPEALAALREALTHHARLPDPGQRARTLLILGVTLRRAGERRRAREALAEARAAFDAIGENLWAERARAEAARLGGRTASGDELTPTEHRVAELVAQGHSNREVAEALYITIRTVEANLTRIYAKLGVRSRSQLTARWGAPR